MAEVHLEEEAAARREEGDAPRRPRAKASWLRRGWPVPAAAALGLVAWQAGSAAQDRAALERLRETPGVIAETVTPPLDAIPWGSRDSLPVLVNGVGTEDGLVAGAVTDGARVAVTAVEPATGTEAWRVDLPSADGGTPAAAPSCSSGGGEQGRATLWCVVTGSSAPEPGGTSTRLVGIDLSAGAVTSERALGAGTESVIAGEALVVATEDGDVLDVVATHLTTGAPRWHARVPDRFGPNPPGSRLSASGRHVLLDGASGDHALDVDTGAVRASAPELVVARGDRLVEIRSGTRSALPDGDGTSTPPTWGRPRFIGPDDGTVPDVLLLDALDGSSGGRLRALDAGTGEVRWERPGHGRSQTNLVLLQGVLYGSSNSTVWAVDAATGAELWSTEGGSPAGDQLMTDGVTLLRSERAPGSGRRELAAYEPGTGERIWAAAVPEDILAVRAEGGVLIGQSETGSFALG
ncbi:outer membrane protein assembly factor BamB family protein [Cellulomonas sp. Marseille-Q8402]